MATKSSKKTSASAKKVASAKEKMNRCKIEAANEVGVSLKQGYNGDVSAKDAGSVGGQMVKKMVKKYKKDSE